jgi:2-methylcitrate dehydratase PrpD
VITERDARVSIHHSVACVLQRGAAGVLEFAEPVVFQPEIVGLREKVTAQMDNSLPDGAARVSIRTRSGKILSEEVMSARGSLANPLSDADIEAKLRECARSGETKWDPERLIEAIWRLETLPDIAPLGNSSSGYPL